MKEKEMIEIANLIDKITKLAEKVQSSLEPPNNKLKDFLFAINNNNDYKNEIENFKNEVVVLTKDFPLPGIDPTLL